jgi:exodeoxyribonuclease-3
MITIASWNVNSIRARLDVFREWLKKEDPDIILLQEIKCLEEFFPQELSEKYNLAISGQKTFNGVAILSKFPLEDVRVENLKDDIEARYIEAAININNTVLRCVCVYVPNGREMNSKHYFYKLDFMKALMERLLTLNGQEEKVLIGGDFNIAPHDFDVYPEWNNELFCSKPERLSLQNILDLGYLDVGEKSGYTWWDYRGQSFKRNKGMRIDHFLMSHSLKSDFDSFHVDQWVRSNFQKTSDHAPIRIVLGAGGCLSV